MPSPPENFGIDVHGRYSFAAKIARHKKMPAVGKKVLICKKKSDIFMGVVSGGMTESRFIMVYYDTAISANL